MEETVRLIASNVMDHRTRQAVKAILRVLDDSSEKVKLTEKFSSQESVVTIAVNMSAGEVCEGKYCWRGLMKKAPKRRLLAFANSHNEAENLTADL